MESCRVHMTVVVALFVSVSLSVVHAQTRSTTPSTDSLQRKVDHLERRLQGLDTVIGSAISDLRGFVREQVRYMDLELRQTWDKITQKHQGSKVYRGCEDALERRQKTSGVYTIDPYLNNTMDVYCEQTEDGAWTVIQARNNGTVDFYKNWNTYKGGFGYLTGEFWLGNENIYELTKNHDQQLRIELTSPDGEVKYADYKEFWIGDEASKYILHVSNYTGLDPPGDCMSYHNGYKFTTKDANNDNAYGNCATKYTGAWWYNNCHKANLNGEYGSTAYGIGLNWEDWLGLYKSLKATRMMIKRRRPE